MQYYRSTYELTSMYSTVFKQYTSLFHIIIVHHFCNGDVRLVGGNSVSEGRVEICYNGVWGSVCNHGWSNVNAAIVCRQLGFQGESKQTIMCCM